MVILQNMFRIVSTPLQTTGTCRVKLLITGTHSWCKMQQMTVAMALLHSEIVCVLFPYTVSFGYPGAGPKYRNQVFLGAVLGMFCRISITFTNDKLER